MPTVIENLNYNDPLNGEVSSIDFVGGDGIIIAPGPPLFSDLSNDGVSVNNLETIGLIQGLNINSSKGLKKFGELGSSARYIVTTRGRKVASLPRIITKQRNILKALYSYVVEVQHGNKTNDPWFEGIHYPNGNIWKNIDHELFKRSIGLLVIMKTGDHRILGKIYLENVLIENMNDAVADRDRGIAENVTMTWARTRYLSTGE